MESSTKNTIVSTAVSAVLISCLVAAFLVVRSFDDSDFANIGNLFNLSFLWLLLLASGVFYIVSFRFNVIYITQNINSHDKCWLCAVAHVILFLVLNITIFTMTKDLVWWDNLHNLTSESFLFAKTVIFASLVNIMLGLAFRPVW